jgi:hypothetical protein
MLSVSFCPRVISLSGFHRIRIILLDLANPKWVTTTQFDNHCNIDAHRGGEGCPKKLSHKNAIKHDKRGPPIIDAHRGGRGGRGGAPHVPPIKIFENFHIKMQ